MKVKREQNKVDVVEKGQTIEVGKKSTADLIADARSAEAKAAKHDQKTAAPKNNKVKHEKATAAKAPMFSDQQLLDALKAIGRAATSREISDKLGIKNPDVGRQMIRTRMSTLIKVGKVKGTAPTDKKTHIKLLYTIA